MAKGILKILNSLVDLLVFLVLLIPGAYSVYALRDNARIYAEAENVRADMLSLKPDAAAPADNSRSFEELRKVNPDVCAWLSLDSTKIDYPVVQGENNLSYLNTDVYSRFALAGSIFLDSRCNNGFHEGYCLLYGHHMDNSRMFGDLDLYKDERFFNANSDGVLILPDRSYKLEIFACLSVPASENSIFEPQLWRDDTAGLIDYIRENSELLRLSSLERILSSDKKPQILGMSTCSSEFTDARTVVLAVMEEENEPEKT